MSIAALDQHTYLPDAGDQVALVHDFLTASEEAGREEAQPRYLLSGPGGEQVELPPEAYRVLRQVIEAMRQDLAVTVAPQSQRLTTQQAGDLLGVSRPTVVKLLDAGEIPFERIATHRRILLRDLLAFRERRRRQQYAALEAMSPDVDDEGDVQVVLGELRDARQAAARQRRKDADPQAR